MRRFLGIFLLLYFLSGCAGMRPVPERKFSFFDPQKLKTSIRSYLGTPYQWGGNSHRGMDCSGLVVEVFKEQGISLPRTVRGLRGAGIKIYSFSKLRLGDLLFFRKGRFPLRKSRHLGIYLGEGKFVHASSSKGVVINNFSSYWQKRFSGARRVGRAKK
jgi:cell wall-associated NlpC family hydrolase